MIRIVTGPPCSGKSTHVAASAADGDVIVDFDVLAVALGNKAAHRAAGALREVAHAVRFAAIERVLAGIDADSWIIHTTPSAEQLEKYKAAGAEVVEIDPGLDEVLARAAADERPAGTDQAIRNWYEQREAKSMTTIDSGRHDFRRKAFVQATFKAAGELAADGSKLGPGEFIATAAVFGNVDRYGDRIVKGAFAETLQEWADSGNTLSVIWQHDWQNPFANIGAVMSITETDSALEYRGKVDLEDAFAAKVYGLMKGRRIVQQSFGFDVLDGAEVMENGESIFEIRKVRLYEVGPCLVGVNSATELLDIKSSGVGAPAPAEPSGQATPAAGGPTSASVDSNSEPPASQKSGPASVKLALEILELEGEI